MDPDIGAVADVGQEEDFKAAEAKALKVGAKKFFLEVSAKAIISRDGWSLKRSLSVYVRLCRTLSENSLRNSSTLPSKLTPSTRYATRAQMKEGYCSANLIKCSDLVFRLDWA